MTEPQRRPGVAQPVQKLNPHYVALGILCALILAGLIFIFAGGGPTSEDKLGDQQATANVDIEDPEARCANSAYYDRIKTELFNRAAAGRTEEREAFDKLAKFAVLRAETPILRGYDQRTNTVSCSAYVSIDLPPGVAAAGARRTISAEVGYAIQGDRLSLTDAETIVGSLATLSLEGQPPEAGLDDTLLNGDASVPEIPVGTPESANKETGPATSYPGRPSFDCDDAGTRGEIAVCQNSGLAALDVNMATQYRRAVGAASPQKRAILAQTRDRFLSYRDNCPTVGCMRDAYVGRMQEIRDIMEGRWRPR